jgi:hypothetical protein
MPRLPLALAALGAALLFAPAAAPAGTPTIVVAEVFAGGGNSGAPYANDYVELFNRSSSTVNLSGWTLQYASASSTAWDVTPLSGTLGAGDVFLVKLASNGAVGAALPAADATGTTNLAASGGKLAVVSTATALTCGATAGSCTASSIADLVGYGTATDYEGQAAPAATNTLALVRAGGGCTDSDDNAADFATGTPSPRNAAGPESPCGTTGGSGGTAVSVALDLQSVIALGLDRTSISFGSVVGGTTPSPVAVAATVTSNNPTGYTLVATRTAFTPADLPLGVGVGAAALTAVPAGGSSSVTLASASAPSSAGGDVVATRIGFTAALPTLLSGHYAGTVTYTVIAR